MVINGTAENLITAELSNWKGKAIRIPRMEMSAVSDHNVPSLETCEKTHYNLRNALVKEGIIADRAYTRDMKQMLHPRLQQLFWGIHLMVMLIGKRQTE